ncbi:hypothetical protein D0867_14615 [Hortaea werneckii]|uniref:Uncharacterized protein n=1 Tax=Hortaea werneckii TaxID=91943 RepID=A0A3M6XNJ3_HORWE|nr:hypothetical protein D0867_14615 [Hortaea werneckii]
MSIMAQNRDLVEEAHPRDDAEADPEPVKQRTVEQQKKQDNIIAQNKRLNGEESNRSRSQSRRARRKRIQQMQDDGKFMKTNSLPALEEADANQELQAMGPFERIGPDSTSMDGPVTMARAERGEIPVRGTHPGQPYYMKPKQENSSELKDTDGLKLSLEANLDIEIELKASIRGDLTLSLFHSGEIKSRISPNGKGTGIPEEETPPSLPTLSSLQAQAPAPATSTQNTKESEEKEQSSETYTRE